MAYGCVLKGIRVCWQFISSKTGSWTLYLYLVKMKLRANWAVSLDLSTKGYTGMTWCIWRATLTYTVGEIMLLTTFWIWNTICKKKWRWDKCINPISTGLKSDFGSINSCFFFSGGQVTWWLDAKKVWVGKGDPHKSFWILTELIQWFMIFKYI